MNQEIVNFFRWLDTSLKDRGFCYQHFPEHTEERDDWDFGGKYNYIWHRYHTMFEELPIAFLTNTPTFRRKIWTRMTHLYLQDHYMSIQCNEFLQTFWLFPENIDTYWHVLTPQPNDPNPHCCDA